MVSFCVGCRCCRRSSASNVRQAAINVTARPMMKDRVHVKQLKELNSTLGCGIAGWYRIIIRRTRQRTTGARTNHSTSNLLEQTRSFTTIQRVYISFVFVKTVKKRRKLFEICRCHCWQSSQVFNSPSFCCPQNSKATKLTFLDILFVFFFFAETVAYVEVVVVVVVVEEIGTDSEVAHDSYRTFVFKGMSSSSSSSTLFSSRWSKWRALWLVGRATQLVSTFFV